MLLEYNLFKMDFVKNTVNLQNTLELKYMVLEKHNDVHSQSKFIFIKALYVSIYSGIYFGLCTFHIG